MPRERIFGPHEGETYRQHLTRLQEADIADFTPASKAASLMAAMMLMQGGSPNRSIDREQFNENRRKLEENKTFKKMMEDPRNVALVQNNNIEGLFASFSAAEAQRRQAIDAKYQRPREPEVLAEDAEILKTAIRGLKDSAGNAPAVGSPENERRGKLYQEMMKRLEHAQSMAEKGIQLDGESTKALIGSIKAYNNGGKTNVPAGGETKAEGFTQSMALLKHYMPVQSFERYCKKINEAQDTLEPRHPGYVAPESFEPACMTGGMTAKRLTNENRVRMENGFTLDVAAEALAIQQLSEGNPNKLITPAALEEQKRTLKKPGTAFMKVMMDDKARENLRRQGNLGLNQDVVEDLNKGMRKAEQEMREQARKSVVRTAQGEINRSITRLTGGGPMNRYFTEQYLANILASEQLAMNATGNERITNGAFRERAEQLRQDPAFQRLADRYMNDAVYRENMNRGLQADRSAQNLAAQYQLEKQPVHYRRDPEPQMQQAQPMQPGFQQAQPGFQPIQPGFQQAQPVRQPEPVQQVQPVR